MEEEERERKGREGGGMVIRVVNGDNLQELVFKERYNGLCYDGVIVGLFNGGVGGGGGGGGGGYICKQKGIEIVGEKFCFFTLIYSKS